MSAEMSVGYRQSSDVLAGSGGYRSQHLRGNNRHNPSGVWGFHRDRRKLRQKTGAEPFQWMLVGPPNGSYRQLAIECDGIPWFVLVAGWGWSRNVDVGLDAGKRPESTESTEPTPEQADEDEAGCSALGRFHLPNIKKKVKSKTKKQGNDHSF